MKWFSLILIFLVSLSCGGMLPGKIAHAPVIHKVSIDTGIHDRRLFLDALESKYLKEKKGINLAIVRSMIVELEGKYPALSKSEGLPDLKDLRNKPAFLSLELTVEHLSHRESVKLSARQSAFVHP